MVQKKLFLIKIILLSLLLCSSLFAQNKIEKGLYVIRNVGMKNFHGQANKSYLNLSKTIKTAKDLKMSKPQLVMGKEYMSSDGQFYLIPEGDVYQIKSVYNDNTWGVLTIEDTFKKEGARVFVEYDEIKADNKITHRQRFRLEKTKNGNYFIRTLDGRYLRSSIDDKFKLGLSPKGLNSEEPKRQEFSEWSISKPNHRF